MGYHFILSSSPFMCILRSLWVEHSLMSALISTVFLCPLKQGLGPYLPCVMVNLDNGSPGRSELIMSLNGSACLAVMVQWLHVQFIFVHYPENVLGFTFHRCTAILPEKCSLVYQWDFDMPHSPKINHSNVQNRAIKWLYDVEWYFRC